MGEAAFEEDAPFLEQPLRAAAVVCRTEHGNLHTGVLHRNVDGEAEVLHLAWKDNLVLGWEGNAGPWRRLWAAPCVEPERLMSIAGKCRLIRKKFREKQKFPSAIRFAQSTFTPGGHLVLGEGSKGLTCATFVLAVFNSMGIALVDEDDWPIRQEDDRQYLKSVSSFAKPEHLTKLTDEVEAGVRRVQPQEVVGACAFPPSAKFAQANGEGVRVIAMLAEQ